MRKPMPENDRTELELMVDRYSISEVLDALSVIALDKSEHVLSYWQDKYIAGKWSTIAKRIEKLSVNLVSESLSR